MQKTVAAAALSAALLAGPVSGLLPEPERESGQKPSKDEIGKPLAELAAGKRDPKTLRIEVIWAEGRKRSSARLFGNGVGIWNDSAQLRLSRTDVSSIASALNQARFGAMSSQLGEAGDLPRLHGMMEVSIAGKTKKVVQLADGEQSEAFSALASRILDLAGERAKTGVTASSLADALAKLSTGALAPEVLRLTAVRRQEQPDATARGWLLQVEGRQVLARPLARGGYGSQRRLELSDAEARSLAGALRESNPESLPSNLYGIRLHVAQDRRPAMVARSSRSPFAQRHGRDARRPAEGLRPPHGVPDETRRARRKRRAPGRRPARRQMSAPAQPDQAPATSITTSCRPETGRSCGRRPRRCGAFRRAGRGGRPPSDRTRRRRR